MIRNQSGQVVNAQVNQASPFQPFTGTVSVNVTIDNSAQAAGAGTVTAKGTGQYQYAPTAAETNGTLIAFQFVGTGAIDQLVNVETLTAGQAAAASAAAAPGALTVTDLLTLVAKRINILPEGRSLGAATAADMLQYANIWIDSLAIERLTIPYIARTTWTISSTKGTLASPYTVGTGGDISVVRPSLASAITIRYQNTAVSPTLELPLTRLTDQAWQGLPQKNLTSTLPSAAYYNPTYAGNLGSLYLWMVPSQTSLEGVLYSPAYLSQFGALTEVLVLPPGYAFFMQENLAVMFSPTFRDGLPPDPDLMRSALGAKQAIQRANVTMSDLSIDVGALSNRQGWYSIYADGPV